MYFDEEVCFFNEIKEEQNEVFKTIADTFYNKGLVHDTFYNGIVDREKNFPTGLCINGIGVAIPHTDSDKVKRSQVGFMSLKEPVTFKDMGDINTEVKVNLIFMLALKEAHEQIGMLQNLMELFQNEDLMKNLIDCSNKEDYLKIIRTAGLN